MARLRIEDDGIGLPASRRGGSLGLTLIETLARQIHGRATVEARRGGQGTAVLITFPVPGHPSGPS